MSKVLSRRMFNGPRPTANGTGITAYFSNGGLADSETFKNMFTQYKDVLSSQLAPEKSYEELLAQRMKILGPEDPESARNYALMQLGGKIASTTGGLGVALGAGLPEYASVMQKDEAEQRQLQRAAAGSALDALTQQQNTRQSVGMEAAKAAFSESTLAAREAAKAKADAAMASEENRLEIWKENEQTNRAFGVLKPEAYIVPDTAPNSPTGKKVVTARMTKDGLKDSFGNLLPNDAIPAPAGYLEKMLGVEDPKASVNIQIQKPDGEFGDNMAATQIGPKFYNAATGEEIKTPFRLYDPTYGKPQTSAGAAYVVVDANSRYGIKEVIGFQDKITGETFYMNNNIKVVFDSASGRIGSIDEVVKTNVQGNRVSTTIDFGPFKGRTFPSGLEPVGINDDPLAPKQGDTLTPLVEQQGVKVTPPVEQQGAPGQPPVEQQGVKVTPPKILPGVGAITGEGDERYFVTKAEDNDVGNPYLTFSKMTPEQVSNSMGIIDNGESMLNNIESVLTAIPEATGAWATVKGLSTNIVASVVPDSVSAPLEFFKTEAGARLLQLFRQDIRRAQALNPRFPVGELAVIDEIIEKPKEFFANPKAAMARMQELIRVTRNNIEWEKSKLENRPPNYLNRIPTGTLNDPFSPDKMGYLKAREAAGINLKGVIYEIIDPNTGKKYKMKY